MTRRAAHPVRVLVYGLLMAASAPLWAEEEAPPASEEVTTSQGQPTQGQPTQGQPTQGQPTQGQPTQSQPTQGQPPSVLPGSDVVIIQHEDETVEEYRIGGRVYMIKVEPGKGVPYYLVDTDGDGKLETHYSDLTENIVIPQWVLFRWNR